MISLTISKFALQISNMQALVPDVQKWSQTKDNTFLAQKYV